MVTKDYSENLSDGILICGINFGYSAGEEHLEKARNSFELEPKSFFSDSRVNKTRFRKRILGWLEGWGCPLATREGQEGGFERSFFQTNWLNSQTRSVSSDGKITCELLVDEAQGFLELVEARRPSVILFFGALLIEAFNDIRLRDRVVAMLGARSGNANVHRGTLKDYSGKRFFMKTQHFGNTRIMGLPHPQTRGLSDIYVGSFEPPARILKEMRERAAL
ncbi:MAG TPA: hypothetical protein DD670_03790 [Planctomycetaceae bacterium]|nr:hypothetical protein [Planctomycetaceae bacterium]